MHARAPSFLRWVVSTMNVPEGYAALPRVELGAPRPVGRPRAPAGSQDKSRHFMLQLNVGWTEKLKPTVNEKGSDVKITSELAGPRTLDTGQLCACFALKDPRNASWLNRNTVSYTHLTLPTILLV